MPFHIRPFLMVPLALIVLLSSGPASAVWERLDKSDDGMTTYSDPATIRRKGDLVKMWHLLDYETIQTVSGISFSSIKVQNAYDCTEERLRSLSHTWFSGNMGSGNPVADNSDEAKWKPVVPESIAERLWKHACDKE